MRENKFRAYDKINKRFMYITLHPTHIGWSNPYWIAQGLLRGEDENVEGIGFSGIEGWNQYTGLKDKNGKEIYEGDVLRDTLCEGISNNNILVIFREDLSSFALSKNGWMHDHFFKEGVEANATEIIGNIYDNPEILKSEGIVK